MTVPDEERNGFDGYADGCEITGGAPVEPAAAAKAAKGKKVKKGRTVKGPRSQCTAKAMAPARAEELRQLSAAIRRQQAEEMLQEGGWRPSQVGGSLGPVLTNRQFVPTLAPGIDAHSYGKIDIQPQGIEEVECSRSPRRRVCAYYRWEGASRSQDEGSTSKATSGAARQDRTPRGIPGQSCSGMNEPAYQSPVTKPRMRSRVYPPIPRLAP